MTPVSILIVCTGNICRSPYGHLLLQAGLNDVAPGAFRVQSAGTRAAPGRPVDPLALDLLRSAGVDGGAFVSQPLHAVAVADHDLVLTMTRAQRAEVLASHPAALKRVFTLREFSRLLGTLDPSIIEDPSITWSQILPMLTANRTAARAADPLDDDVADPYRRGPDAFAAMAEQVSPCIMRIVELERIRRRADTR